MTDKHLPGLAKSLLIQALRAKCSKKLSMMTHVLYGLYLLLNTLILNTLIKSGEVLHLISADINCYP